jgi:hypothetical protein
VTREFASGHIVVVSFILFFLVCKLFCFLLVLLELVSSFCCWVIIASSQGGRGGGAEGGGMNLIFSPDFILFCQNKVAYQNSRLPKQEL